MRVGPGAECQTRGKSRGGGWRR